MHRLCRQQRSTSLSHACGTTCCMCCAPAHQRAMFRARLLCRMESQACTPCQSCLFGAALLALHCQRV